MQRLPRQQILPDPYLDERAILTALGTAAVSWAIGTWSTAADRAYYVPQLFPVRCTLYALRFQAGNGTGNYDIGVYDAAGTRLASSGSTAMTAAGTKTLSLADISVTAGTLLYAAIALSSTSGSSGRIAYSVAAPTLAIGQMEESSALPLPSTMTPVVSTNASLPIFVWGVR